MGLSFSVANSLADEVQFDHPPPFFISVDSKGLKYAVSRLESTFEGYSVDIDSKRLGTQYNSFLELAISRRVGNAMGSASALLPV